MRLEVRGANEEVRNTPSRSSFFIRTSHLVPLAYLPAARRFPPAPTLTLAAAMVTVAASLSSLPQRLERCTQYVAGVRSGGVVSVSAVPFGTGWEKSPRPPSYHWTKSGAEPVAAA